MTASPPGHINVQEWPIGEYLAKVSSGQPWDAKLLIAGHWLKDNFARIMRV